MADTSKTYHEIKVQLNYDDKDYKTLTIDNAVNIVNNPLYPASNVKHIIDEFGAITVGDKAGGTFTTSSNCQYTEKIVYELDIGVNAT